ncbi:MAG: carotenoid biosynthesis protein [Promethearchaeati archaeon SRVP18_Atabeyarchaeia-1]
MQLSFLGMELMSLVLFAICSWHALRVLRSRQRFLELVMAAVFGVLLEELNVLISGGFYVYGRDFLIIFDQAPLAIGLGWAVIIYSAMYISDAYGLDEKVKPFFDAIQAILIDLSMDAVAIRLGFWRWPIPLTDGWFGVPAGNFFGWMLVVAIYSGITRLTRNLVQTKRDKRYLLLQVVSPPICYGILYSFLLVYVDVSYSIFATEIQRFSIFAIELAIFAMIVLASMVRRGYRIQRRVELGTSLTQITFHVVFLAALLITGMYIQIPAMIPIAGALLVIEVFLHQFPSYKLKKH